VFGSHFAIEEDNFVLIEDAVFKELRFLPWQCKVVAVLIGNKGFSLQFRADVCRHHAI